MKKMLALAAVLSALTMHPAQAKEYVVKMITAPGAKHPYRFSPAKLTIEKGDTVKFIDAQDDQHDVMFESVPKGVGFAMSPMLERRGQSWSYTFTKEGTYEYHCHPHAELGMHGTIIVGKPSKRSEMQTDEHHHHHGAMGNMDMDHMSHMHHGDMAHMSHDDMNHMNMDHGDMSHTNVGHGGMDHMSMMDMPGAFGAYPMTRESSGTSWVPESSPMQGIHLMQGGWTIMLHGDANFVYDHQGGKRGDEETFSDSMLMAMATHALGEGTLGLHAMLSLDPAMGPQGYPLLLQTGETANGVDPLIDRQHPHDLFMELAASYSHPVSNGDSMFVYAGYPGEPALGPPAFMHRPSGEDNPEAPITHHWLDSTHVDFGVATLGYVHGNWKVEASAFNGREPDQFRWNFDPLTMNSYAGRISYNPTKDWAFQVSTGFIKSPEQLEPNVNQHRTTASAIYNKPIGDNNWATTLAWGLDDNHPGHALNAVMLESAYVLHDTHTVFGRAEYAQKDELFVTPSPFAGETFDVGKLSLGYIYDYPLAEHVKIGVGGLGSLFAMPDKLDPTYGENPASAMVFIRLKLK